MNSGILSDASKDKYKHISVPTLVVTGTHSPKYFEKMICKLDSMLSNGTILSLKGLDHNAPDITVPNKIGHVLKNYLEG